jgi:hypothetical protein
MALQFQRTILGEVENIFCYAQGIGEWHSHPLTLHSFDNSDPFIGTLPRVTPIFSLTDKWHFADPLLAEIIG